MLSSLSISNRFIPIVWLSEGRIMSVGHKAGDRMAADEVLIEDSGRKDGAQPPASR